MPLFLKILFLIQKTETSNAGVFGAVFVLAVFVLASVGVDVSGFAVLVFASVGVDVAVLVFAGVGVNVSVLVFASVGVNVSVLVPASVGVNVAGLAVSRDGRGEFAPENEERGGASDEKEKKGGDGDERGRSLIFVVFQFGHDFARLLCCKLIFAEFFEFSNAVADQLSNLRRRK